MRRVCQRITSKAFQEGAELEFSGRIAQLMGIWLKAFELEKLSDIEKRLVALEEEIQKNKEIRHGNTRRY